MLNIENKYDTDPICNSCQAGCNRSFNEGSQAGIIAVLKWLFERCTEHHTVWNPFDAEIHYLDESDDAHYLHHKDCPQCMEKIRKEYGII